MDADTIQIEGLASNKYTVKKNADNGFTITIPAANLAAFAGKTLKTTVKGHLSIEDLTLIDTGIPNKATAKVHNSNLLSLRTVKLSSMLTAMKKMATHLIRTTQTLLRRQLAKTVNLNLQV